MVWLCGEFYHQHTRRERFARAVVPFSNAGVRPEAEQQLASQGVLVFPDYVANCGGMAGALGAGGMAARRHARASDSLAVSGRLTDMWKFEHELEVRFRDCDPLGHVNNAVYLSYLEAARFSWWRHVFGPAGFAAHGFIIARVEIDYRKPALPADRLVVRLKIDAIGKSSFTIKYEIANTRTRELVAEAKSVQVAYDYAAARSLPISADLRARLEASV